MTWQLMLGKNLLWVAKQHGHSVEVMLRMLQSRILVLQFPRSLQGEIAPHRS
ncbi:MAG: hypothetical protein ABSF94_12995 [Steroidobacteraceae bacterium]